MRLGTETRTEGGREGGSETETRVKDLLASGVPPKGLEALINFRRYRGFDAG